MSALLLKWFGREVRRFCHTFCICNSFLQVFARILVCIFKCIFINYFVSISACGHQSIGLQLQKKDLEENYWRFIMFSAPAECRLRRWEPGVSWWPGTGTVWSPRCRSFSELWKASSGAAFEVSESPRRAEMNLSWLWLLTCHCVAAKLLFITFTLSSLCAYFCISLMESRNASSKTHTTT